MDPSAIIGVLSSGIGAAIGWGLARRSNETDQLRNLYADWATVAYDFMKLLQRLLADMDVDALVNQVPISFLIDSVHEDTRAYSKTGIPKARYRLEGANFKAGIADPVPAFAAEVDVLTKRFLEQSKSGNFRFQGKGSSAASLLAGAEDVGRFGWMRAGHWRSPIG